MLVRKMIEMLCMGLAVIAGSAGSWAEEKVCYFDGGEVRIVSSSHQDTAWMDTPGHYYNHQGYLHGKPADCINNISGKLKEQSPYYEKRLIPPAYMLLNSQDFAKPESFSPLIEAWNMKSPMSPGGDEQFRLQTAGLLGPVTLTERREK